MTRAETSTVQMIVGEHSTVPKVGNRASKVQATRAQDGPTEIIVLEKLAEFEKGLTTGAQEALVTITVTSAVDLLQKVVAKGAKIRDASKYIERAAKSIVVENAQGEQWYEDGTHAEQGDNDGTHAEVYHEDVGTQSDAWPEGGDYNGGIECETWQDESEDYGDDDAGQNRDDWW